MVSTSTTIDRLAMLGLPTNAAPSLPLVGGPCCWLITAGAVAEFAI